MKTNVIPCPKSLRGRGRRSAGFSIVELLVASFVGVIVAAMMISSLIMNLRGQKITTAYNENISEANQGLQRIIYGFNGAMGLREANADVFRVTAVSGGVIMDFGEEGRKIVYNETAGTVIDNKGIVYAEGVTDFQATKIDRRVILSLTVREEGLEKPVEQTLRGEILLRNVDPPKFDPSGGNG